MNFRKLCKFLFFREGICFLVCFLLIWFICILLYFKSIKITNLFLLLYLLGLISLFIIIFIILLIVINYLLKQLSLKKTKKYQNIENPEVAIILGDDSWQIYSNILISSYLGLRFLIKYLELKKKRFKIYISPSKKEFDKLIQDENIKIFYLIGHGSKYGFYLNKKEDPLFYKKYENYKSDKKEEIHLYHCTNSKENPKSIIDYLVIETNKKRCFITNNKIKIIDIIFEFYKLYKSAQKERLK